MRIGLVSYHVPDPAGSAAGRMTHAAVTGMIDAGHDVRVWAWRHEPPAGDLPPWCRWEPDPGAPAWRVRARALARPRSDIARARWPFPDDGWLDGAIAMAEDVPSYEAVRRRSRRVVALHSLASLDQRALGVRTAAGVQDVRAERRTTRHADRVLGHSPRVAARAGGVAIPPGYALPPVARPPTEHPTAVVAADWRWAPNRRALDLLLRAWPLVRDRVPGGRLALVGTGLDPVGAVAGVDVVGPVADTGALLAEAAVVPFPYPPTSGPKVKVMEALASGVPVVTTAWGLEGLHDEAGAGAVVVTCDDVGAFADALASVLAAPERAAALGGAGRRAMERHHTPTIAGAARVDAVADLLDR